MLIDRVRRALLITAAGAGAGYVVGRADWRDPIVEKSSVDPDPYKEEYLRNSRFVYTRHFEQTQADVERLRSKYAEPIFGEVSPTDLLEKLSLCIDETDETLFCTNQLTHTLQVVEGMERDGVRDDTLLLAALLHDVGKVLLLVGESPENVVCYNTPIGKYSPSVRLDAVLFQWNHDEFGYSRFRDHVTDSVAWLIRYHSIDIGRARPYMDARDLTYLQNYLSLFRRYDQGTKSPYNLPRRSLLDYHDLLALSLPERLVV